MLLLALKVQNVGQSAGRKGSPGKLSQEGRNEEQTGRKSREVTQWAYIWAGTKMSRM